MDTGKNQALWDKYRFMPAFTASGIATMGSNKKGAVFSMASARFGMTFSPHVLRGFKGNGSQNPPWHERNLS